MQRGGGFFNQAYFRCHPRLWNVTIIGTLESLKAKPTHDKNSCRRNDH